MDFNHADLKSILPKLHRTLIFQQVEIIHWTLFAQTTKEHTRLPPPPPRPLHPHRCNGKASPQTTGESLETSSETHVCVERAPPLHSRTVLTPLAGIRSSKQRHTTVTLTYRTTLRLWQSTSPSALMMLLSLRPSTTWANQKPWLTGVFHRQSSPSSRVNDYRPVTLTSTIMRDSSFTM